MAVVTNDIVKFVAKGVMLSGNEWNWVWHYKMTTGPSEPDLTVLTALRDHLDLAVAGLEVHIDDDVDSTETELFVWDAVLNRFDGTAQLDWTTFNGTNVSEVMPNQVAGLTKAFTNVGRRQGRKYVPGFTEPGVIGNTLSAGVLAALGVWAAIMDNGVVAGAGFMSPGVWNVDITSPLFETFEQFAGVVAIDTNPSTQRRRKPNVGI